MPSVLTTKSAGPIRRLPPLADLLANLADLQGIAEREERHFEALAAGSHRRRWPGCRFSPTTSTTSDGLTEVGRYLFGSSDHGHGGQRLKPGAARCRARLRRNAAVRPGR